jgi:hypothetical protein
VLAARHGLPHGEQLIDDVIAGRGRDRLIHGSVAAQRLVGEL